MSKQLTSKWRNRIVGHGVMPAGQFLANPLNWRLHPEFQQEALSGVLDEVGWVDEVTINKRTGQVVDGHLRVTLALRESESEPVPYREVDLSPEEEAEVLATKDPIAALAGSDPAQFAGVLEQFNTGDAALQQMIDEMSFDQEMKELLAGEDSDSRGALGKAANTVRVVLRVDSLSVVEQALMLAALPDRGESLALICQEWMDAKG